MDRNEYIKIRTHVLELLEKSGTFPNNVEISLRDETGSAFVAVISWPLNNDSARPHKRSTEISLVIDGRAMETYKEIDEKGLTSIDSALLRVVRERLKSYREDFGLPRAEAASPFQIRVGAVDLH